jgi:adenine-specific DNA-methyltransferase
VLETIARYDDPEVRGVTGLRPYEDQQSTFCSSRTALGTLEKMVGETPARHVFLSYNNEGIMPREEILETFGRYGEAELVTRERARFRADVDRENRVYKGDRVEEQLYCLRKG